MNFGAKQRSLKFGADYRQINERLSININLFSSQERNIHPLNSSALGVLDNLLIIIKIGERHFLFGRTPRVAGLS